ncbi:alpha/beta hydrolase [Psychromarinibacter sp. C21-152]|uniref:Alpha/beta hydrolase n=1 Tax=Psychromarinibacter sediminicola TaxID=3033385 RepID=A0AAE3NWR1_9RHOB|nr:alpha/beta hydrolase [Psychromarinibacter sediminicola]MDF0603089.1 alpha/beta hydrolase [Psychromarinibacter sediminicola]
MTLVYVPGLASDARVWRPVAERVGGAFVIADVSGPERITDMAEGVLAQAAGSVIPVGHSMGGRVAMEMARIAPERMRGLVLADTGYRPLGPGEAEKRLAKVALGHRDMEALVADWLPPMVDPGRHGDTALMDDLREMILAAGPDQHARQIRALIGRPDAGASLGDVTCPVLLLVGATDGWAPRAQHEEIADLVAGPAKVVEVAGAGHFLPVEKPDETAAAIADWLNRHRLR